jgi:exosortase/archaeosortase family protein
MKMGRGNEPALLIFARRQIGLVRTELFGCLFIIGCVNGFAGKVVSTVSLRGWPNAAMETFDISAIAVFSCACGVRLVLRGNKKDILSSADIIISVLLFTMVALPVPALAWVGVTGLALYVLAFKRVGVSGKRGAAILLAATVPMLWSRLLFHLLANPILQVDAALVSWVLGTARAGNIVQFADGSGTLVILEGCSSLANMSLVLPCWITISTLSRHRPKRADLFWCVLACLAVLAVNVLRISIMGLSVSDYNAVHDGMGSFVVNTVVVGLIVGICLAGTRKDVLSPSKVASPHRPGGDGQFKVSFDNSRGAGHDGSGNSRLPP